VSVSHHLATIAALRRELSRGAPLTPTERLDGYALLGALAQCIETRPELAELLDAAARGTRKAA